MSGRASALICQSSAGPDQAIYSISPSAIIPHLYESQSAFSPNISLQQTWPREALRLRAV